MAKKILIAEDEKPMARALELKLNNSGYEAKAVYDGEEAVAALNKEKFDLMILDLIMPKLDGFGVLEKIKDKKLKTQIIVASNLSQEEDIDRVKSLGAVGFFVKSDTPINEIVGQVEKYLS